jgi:hypothetical protein
MLVRTARFAFGPGPHNDWQVVLYRPGGDRALVKRSTGTPEIATALCDVII